jgi:hypothetical protein
MAYTYALTATSNVLRSDGAFIPTDPRNAGWQAYQAWLVAGNTPTPYVVPPSVPTTLQIISTGTPVLSGTYALSPLALDNINSVALYIQVNAAFPGGQSTITWPDASGGLHIFTTTAKFISFANAVANYVAALDAAVLGAGTAPTQPVTIP